MHRPVSARRGNQATPGAVKSLGERREHGERRG